MIAVDVGGTFTDVVALRDGVIETAKVPTNVQNPYQPVLQGSQELDVARSDVFNHASTHGLNAVITRNLPKIGFLTTDGHRDMLDMGRVWRPAEAILDADWRRTFGDADRPLVPRYLRRGIAERMLASGEVLADLDEVQAREQLRLLGRCNVQGVAICLINAYVNPAHEQRLRELVREELGDDVACSISSDVSPLAKEYARASTTVIDTFMKLIYSEYSAKLSDGLRDLGFTGAMNYADCAATLVPADRVMEEPFRIVFSGPSAGTVACSHFGAMIGETNLLCADVGGTSCDMSVVTDATPLVNTTFELEHDLVVNALANDITAIGAGGGSLVTVGRTGEIRVGPGSAGADPGPACYGRGGTQPTTTDTFVMMGIIDPKYFAGGRVSLDVDLARQAFEALDVDLTLAQRVRHAHEIAVNNISQGILNIAIKNGVDPREYSLVAYGAAGPMTLPAVLDSVRCKEVIIPPHPGLFSALGLLSTDQVFTVNRSAYTVLSPDTAARIDALFTEMEQQVRERLGDADVVIERSFDGHLVGQSWETPFVPVPGGTVDADAIGAVVRSFHDTYEERSGNRFDGIPVEGVTFRVRAIQPTDKVAYTELPERTAGQSLSPTGHATLRYLTDDDSEQSAPVYERADLRRGDTFPGPAIVNESLSTTFVGIGQVATVGRLGEIHITIG